MMDPGWHRQSCYQKLSELPAMVRFTPIDRPHRFSLASENDQQLVFLSYSLVGTKTGNHTYVTKPPLNVFKFLK